MSRAAPGAQLSEGRIRVDAAKALAKLREYQLTDRTAWVLEGLRGAVAAGATAITLDGDANDIWLAWEGPSLTDAELTGLFDELVSPETTTERQHLRLIAAAVNSALGMGPAYVDVYAIRPTGTLRARYTSEIFDGAEALRQLEAEEVDRTASPFGAAATGRSPGVDRPARPDGMLIHLRRRLGLELLRYLTSEPPELPLARAACREISVPLRVGTTTLHRADLGADLVRVKLADLDGFLAIGASSLAPNALLTVAERGVALVEVPLDLGLPHGDRASPLRAYLDAPRMPTNASRSDVRRTGHPLATAESRTRDALPALVAALVERVTADPGPHNPARAAVFRWLASTCTNDRGVLRLSGAPAVLKPLLDLPLVHTATGTAVPLGSVQWDSIPHTGPTPYPEALAPWLDVHMWIPPDDPAALLFAPGSIQHGLLARGPMRRRARWARRGLKRREKFFGHAQRPPVLQGSGYYLRAHLGVRAPGSTVDPPVFRDLTGEVALMRPDTAAGQLVILHTGRVLERLELSLRPNGAAVIESPRITPQPAFTSAERGPAFDELQTVVKAAITCLGEALSLLLVDQPDPRFAVVGERDPELERRLVREIVAGLYQAHEQIPTLIQNAPVWRTVLDTFVSLSELRREAVIGVGRAEAAAVMPEGRIVLAQPVDRAMLRQLAPRSHVVDYTSRPHEAPVDAFMLAHRLTRSTGIALAIQQRARASGAVGPAFFAFSRVGISHTGIKLDEIEYQHELTPVEILVDDAAIVPTADWRRIDDDAGILSRSFEGWETALLRAIAATLAGERPRELVGSDFSLDDNPGQVLCKVLAAGNATRLLGEDLVAELAAAPLFDVLGDPVPISAAELATRHPTELAFVTPEAVAAHVMPPGARLDPAPLVASPEVAAAAAALVDRIPRDASDSLADLARQQRRGERLAAHRLKPTQPLALRGLTVPLHGAFTGLVGMGAGATTIAIRVEGRDFGHEIRRGPPVEAIVELPEPHVDAEFESAQASAITDIVFSVHLAVPRLVQALIAEQAATLATPCPGRTFLAGWLQFARPQGPRRAEIVAAPLWPTVRGGPLVALASAVRGLDDLWVTTWTGEWLGPTTPKDADPLDTHVLVVDEGELRAIYAALHAGKLVDVTAQIAKLQSRRRIQRGLTRQPTVPNAPPELMRDLASLGAEGKALGPGQIALLDTPLSCVYLHAGGELRARVALTVLPPVAIAIEAADLVPPGSSPHATGIFANDAVTAALEHPVQELARLLVEAVTRHKPYSSLAPAVRRQLARAVMTRKLTNHDEAQLFETLVPDPLATAPWSGWSRLLKQQDSLGSVWYVTAPPPDRTPLDPGRCVFLLDAADARTAAANGLVMVDAARELHLDAVSRRNQGRPPIDSLELAVPVLASVPLPGDGITAPRGVVGVLDPSRAAERKLHPHRRGHPFDAAADPCPWPTIAEVDYDGLSPDRTWAAAVPDSSWDTLVDAVRDASRRALATYAPQIPDGMTAEWVNDEDCFGAVWLGGAPLAPLGIHVMKPGGTFTFTPLYGLGMEGSLVTLATDRTNVTLNAVCMRAYHHLVRAIALSVPTDDAGLAHVAYALGTKRLGSAHSAIRFPCFTPAPLDPAELLALLDGDGPISVLDERDPDPRPALVLDNSILATTLLAVIGERRRRGRPVVRTPRPPTAPPPPSPPHRLQPLVDALHRRLGAIGIRVPAWTIAEDAGPLVRWERNRLVIAADHPRTLAIAAHVITRSPDASGFVDLLAAHAATVMNVALTDITDANERTALAILARDS